MIFKVEKFHGSIEDCECCGMYSAEGVFVFANDELIWKKYSDGHMYGIQSEESILEAMLNYWEASELEKIESEYSEDARNDWNLKHPGNGIARTQESWKEYVNEKEAYLRSLLENVKSSCERLPYDETIQVKMIALWLEENSGEELTVKVSTVSEKTVNEEYLSE